MERSYKKETNVEATVFDFNGRNIYVKDFGGWNRNLRVLGYVSGKRQETDDKVVYSFEPIPIKDQKTCRKVLRHKLKGLDILNCPITFVKARESRGRYY